MIARVRRVAAAIDRQATLRPRVWGVPFRVAFGVLTIATVLVVDMLLLAVGPGMFTVAALFALAPLPVYVGLVLWLDRNEPEPRWILLKSFLWGAIIAVLLSIYGNELGMSWALANGASVQASDLFAAVFVAPIVEEVTKGLALVLLLIHQHDELDSIVDGVIYASMIALGFAATENVLYYGNYLGAGLEIVQLRGFFSPFAHPLFTSMTGIGIALAAHQHGARRVLYPLAGLAAAVLLHMIWNGGASVGAFGAMYILIMVPVLAAVLALVAATLRRERWLIKQYLQPEAEAGIISAEDLAMLSRAEGLNGFRQGLLGTVQTRAVYLARLRARNAAAELALLRWRREHRQRRGTASDEHLCSELVRRIAELRSATASMGVLQPVLEKR